MRLFPRVVQYQAASVDWAVHQHELSASLPNLSRADVEQMLVGAATDEVYLLRSKKKAEIVVSALHTSGTPISHTIMTLDTQQGSWAVRETTTETTPNPHATVAERGWPR